MRFLLSLVGAWRLGVDLDERKGVRKNLPEAYGAASKTVGIGDLEYFNNYKLLSTALDLCRRGIFKLFKEGSPGGWETWFSASKTSIYLSKTEWGSAPLPFIHSSQI